MKRFQLNAILVVTGVIAIALQLDLLLLAQPILKGRGYGYTLPTPD